MGWVVFIVFVISFVLGFIIRTITMNVYEFEVGEPENSIYIGEEQR